ncbi:MAG: hypothetical protein AB7F23_10025, partial [Phycisphaerae bacterium]
KEAPAVDELYNKGRITVDFPDVPVGEWADVVVPFPADDDLLSCSDLYMIQFSIEDGGEDTGSILFDGLFFTDESTDCVPVIGTLVPDMNGDCTVDMIDYAELADGWLTGTE